MEMLLSQRVVWVSHLGMNNPVRLGSCPTLQD
jgi:hypothetical protein